MGTSEYVKQHLKLHNMCFTLNHLQTKRREELNSQIERGNLALDSQKQDKEVEELLFDIIELLFKELGIQENINDLRNDNPILDQEFVDVLFGDNDIENVFDELDTLEVFNTYE